METARLQAVLRELDNRTLGTGRQVLEINKQIGSLCAQAEQYRNTADRILARVSGEDDAGRSADMVSQAYAYISRAEYCEASAGEMQSQADTLKGDLQVCRSEYEYYMGEGERNLENLRLTVEKLTALSGAKYGGGGLAQSLGQTRQRLAFNTKLVDGCRQRIQWIDRICGSGGGQPVRKYTLH